MRLLLVLICCSFASPNAIALEVMCDVRLDLDPDLIDDAYYESATSCLLALIRQGETSAEDKHVAYVQATISCANIDDSKRFSSCAEDLILLADAEQLLDVEAGGLMGRLAKIYKSNGELDKAEEILYGSLLLDDGFPDVSRISKDRRGRVHLRLADIAFDKGDFRAAEDKYRIAHKLMSGPFQSESVFTAEPIRGIARARMQLGDYEVAAEYFGRVAEANATTWGCISRGYLNSLVDQIEAVEQLDNQEDIAALQRRISSIQLQLEELDY